MMHHAAPEGHTAIELSKESFAFEPAIEFATAEAATANAHFADATYLFVTYGEPDGVVPDQDRPAMKATVHGMTTGKSRTSFRNEIVPHLQGKGVNLDRAAAIHGPIALEHLNLFVEEINR